MALKSFLPNRTLPRAPSLLSPTRTALPLLYLQQSNLLPGAPPPPPPPPPLLRNHQRCFFSSTPPTKFLTSLTSSIPTLTPTSPPKTLTANRIIPYPPSKIYSLIADIDSYSQFLPHCTHSRVTAHTADTATRRNPGSLPCLADLTVGYGPLSQSYTSRVYCVPDRGIVEAVSGNAETSIPASVLAELGYDDVDGNKKQTDGGIFERLVTRWEVRPVPPPAAGQEESGKGLLGSQGRRVQSATKEKEQEQDEEEWSDVSLKVTFQFANPALGFAVGHVADMKVDEMIEAFEGRARRLYGGGKGGRRGGAGRL
ncbi:dehydrase and lipid transport-domain-containing protein [Cladorrhinum samala]|uniref:Dehydrase and lipid transport-domain-containing protein n=1 Tax=Cladorrhinum samala TaxID=585594 RepID=A0AAV9HS51_9PEZI|nr:dehydrase and lipid transport-domain-containing protein [Cladorrhinum samala]